MMALSRKNGPLYRGDPHPYERYPNRGNMSPNVYPNPFGRGARRDIFGPVSGRLNRGSPLDQLRVGGRRYDSLLKVPPAINPDYHRGFLSPIARRGPQRDTEPAVLMGALRRQAYGHPGHEPLYGHNNNTCDWAECRVTRHRAYSDAYVYGKHGEVHRGYHDRCGCGKHEPHTRACFESDSGAKKTYGFSTKDVVVRGKTYKFRKSYLTEAVKFEADLVKYMEKKKEDTVPDRVIGLLETFINEEQYPTSSIIDEVTLNILATSLGAKSVVEYSLASLKAREPATVEELVQITIMVLLSHRVDDGLKEWLKKELMMDDIVTYFERCPSWQVAAQQHPEILVRVQTLLGLLPTSDNEGYRIL